MILHTKIIRVVAHTENFNFIQKVLGRIAYFPDTTRTAYKTIRPTILLLLRVYSLPR
jgi:predicted small integral membrane protein